MVTSRIALVRAPNPSAMTLTGTNSYVIDCGCGAAICLDPGPPIPRHVERLLERAAAMQCRIALIAITHSHPDHAPAARLLAQRTGAPVAAHASAPVPHDRALADGEVLRIGDAAIEVMDAPGHTGDHLVFYDPREAALFTGDVVLGSGYVVIAPPGGAMRPYQQTLRRLRERFPNARTMYGGHGDPVGDPRVKIEDYLAHRDAREREIVAALARGAHTIPGLVRAIYAETPRVLWPAAARQILAYLIALEAEGRVRSRELPRNLTPEEAAILNPDWESLAGTEHAETIEAELGASLRIDRPVSYELV